MEDNSHRSPEDIEYAQQFCQPIYDWAIERFKKTKQLDFKLSECKDNFKTVNDCYLMIACDMLRGNGQMLVDTKPRIAKYTLVPNQKDLEDNNKASHKRKSGASEDNDAESDRKENIQDKQPKKLKVVHQDPAPIPQRVLTEKKVPVEKKAPEQKVSEQKEELPRPGKAQDVKITVVDLPEDSSPKETVVLPGKSYPSDFPSGLEYEQMKEKLSLMLKSANDSSSGSIKVSEFREMVSRNYGTANNDQLTRQVDYILQTLQDENKIMLFDEAIWF